MGGFDSVELISADEIDPVPITWLWKGVLARSKLELIAGSPSTGKTTIGLSLASTVSTGGVWPDGSQAPTGDVLIWSGEDDWADTIVPRLITSGANRARVHQVGNTRENGKSRSFNPARDIPKLIDAAKKLPKLSLTIVDPIVSAVTGDSNKNADVRRAIQPLVDFATQTNSAVLGITHFTKNTVGRAPLDRVTGSLAFGAAARLVMMTAKPLEAAAKCCLIRGKSNIGQSGGGYEYELAQKRLPEYGIDEAQFIHWGNFVEGSPEKLFEKYEGRQSSSELQKAKAWLRKRLAGGPVAQTVIQIEAVAAGIAERTLQRAK